MNRSRSLCLEQQLRQYNCQEKACRPAADRLLHIEAPVQEPGYGEPGFFYFQRFAWSISLNRLAAGTLGNPHVDGVDDLLQLLSSQALTGGLANRLLCTPGLGQAVQINTDVLAENTDIGRQFPDQFVLVGLEIAGQDKTHPHTGLAVAGHDPLQHEPADDRVRFLAPGEQALDIACQVAQRPRRQRELQREDLAFAQDEQPVTILAGLAAIAAGSELVERALTAVATRLTHPGQAVITETGRRIAAVREFVRVVRKHGVVVENNPGQFLQAFRLIGVIARYFKGRVAGR